MLRLGLHSSKIFSLNNDIACTSIAITLAANDPTFQAWFDRISDQSRESPILQDSGLESLPFFGENCCLKNDVRRCLSSNNFRSELQAAGDNSVFGIMALRSDATIGILRNGIKPRMETMSASVTPST